MSDKIICEPFNDIPFVDSNLVALAKDIQSAIPNLSYKPCDISTYNMPDEFKQGVCFGLKIYHADDPNTQIGEIGKHRYDGKYTITNRNIDDGRYGYGGMGQMKQSIHAKNIVKIAKKTLAPITIFQHIESCKRNYEQAVQSLRNKWSWEVNQKTNGAFNLAYEDMLYLHSTGYTPKSPTFKNAMEYLVTNREQIDKYHDYKPVTYFVWVKANEVQYIKDGTKDVVKLANKDDLPEDIKGKMFVLDITDGKDFVEGVGLRENESSYWVME